MLTAAWTGLQDAMLSEKRQIAYDQTDMEAEKLILWRKGGEMAQWIELSAAKAEHQHGRRRGLAPRRCLLMATFMPRHRHVHMLASIHKRSK